MFTFRYVTTLSVLASLILFSMYGLSNSIAAETHDAAQVPTNPNAARMLNRTSMKIGGNRYEQITTEPIQGVVCTAIGSPANDAQPSISCVRY